jgi:hypothetical protein
MLNNISNGQWLWVVFSFIFLFLAIFHFKSSVVKLSNVENKGHVKSINGVNVGVWETVESLNVFIKQWNKDNRRMNVVAAFGYLGAMLTAVYSFFLSIK